MNHPNAGSRAAQKRDILARYPMFSTLNPAEIERLAAYARLEHFSRGTMIFSKGDAGSALMAVVSGRVKICVPSADGKEIVFNLVNAGEVFGEIALLDGRPRTAHAIAMNDSEILVLDRREFVPFLRNNPDVALTLLAVLCARVRRTSEQVEDVLFLDLATRLAKLLLSLAEQTGSPRLRVTQKELGQMIGLSRESINKQLQVWAARGWLRIEKGGLVLVDPGALTKLGEQP
jgi:CRP/FNR family transcriptional regulator, cyclic AMP receptor protein